MKNSSLYLNIDKSVSLVHEGNDYSVADYDCTMPENIYALSQILKHNVSAEEKMLAYFLDAKYKLIAFSEISHGITNGSMLNVKGIMQRALLSGATAIIISHNHPSGDTVPSDIDIDATEKIKNACTLLEIALLDHVIVAPSNYYSFQEHGKI